MRRSLDMDWGVLRQICILWLTQQQLRTQWFHCVLFFLKHSLAPLLSSHCCEPLDPYLFHQRWLSLGLSDWNSSGVTLTVAPVSVSHSSLQPYVCGALGLLYSKLMWKKCSSSTWTQCKDDFQLPVRTCNFPAQEDGSPVQKGAIVCMSCNKGKWRISRF